MVSKPFNKHSDNDGEVSFGSFGTQPGAKGPVAVANFIDSAGNQVAQLSKKQMEEWIEKNARPKGVEADIPREQLITARDRIEYFEQRLGIHETPAP